MPGNNSNDYNHRTYTYSALGTWPARPCCRFHGVPEHTVSHTEAQLLGEVRVIVFQPISPQPCAVLQTHYVVYSLALNSRPTAHHSGLKEASPTHVFSG